MSEINSYDLIVIGGGPAGVTAALRAGALGARTALIERARMGGTCTNDGCVPTRVLAKAARLIRDAGQFEEYGIRTSAPELDFETLMTRTQQVVYSIHEKKQLIRHLEESGVDVHTNTGAARFINPHEIATGNGGRFRAERFILSVGGKPRRLPFPGAERALTHSDVWSLTDLPESVVIIGAAATGCQLATIFATFGAEVTLLDIAPTILPGEDAAISMGMQAAFRRRGVRILTGIDGVESIEDLGRWSALHYRVGGAPERLEAEHIIFAVGWPGNVESLDLEAAGVQMRGSYIDVDDTLQTSQPHIYAAGDITGRMMLVQSASYEARVAAENAVSAGERTFDHLVVPHGGFTDPEYASVGRTESSLAEEGVDFTAAVVPYSQMDRAVIDGRPEGFCKLIADRQSHALLGVHVMGEQALEIVHLVAAGMAAGMTVEHLAGLEIAYPTFTAVVGLAARRLAAELTGERRSAAWRELENIRPAEWEILDE